jgi:hypothetical protein
MQNEILQPKINPIIINGTSFFDKFKELTNNSDEITITSGYISEDAIYFLKHNINKLPRFNLAIGMMAIEGFTKSQYSNLIELNQMMIQNNKGLAYVSNSFKFHGKAYSFKRNGTAFASIVGSTNISILGDPEKRQHEIDVLIHEKESVSKIVKIQNELINYSSEISNYKPTKFLDSTQKPLLEAYTNSQFVYVEKIEESKVSEIKKNLTTTIFELPLKCEQKSNLNVFLGKGREGNGLVIPRSWLEAEVIVNAQITRLPNYPTGRIFWVITDDGWKFKIKTGGDNSKNFRSENDLHVLGAWIKGKLLKAGVVKFGQFISEIELQKFGNNKLTLTKSNKKEDNLEIYYLDFSGK